MTLRVTKIFFSFFKYIFFGEISENFQVELLKNLMDSLYIIYEKIACKFEILSENYIKLYEEIVGNEIKVAKIMPRDNVLVIGGGSVPATPILITKKTNAKVMSIDRDYIAIKNASNYLKRHNLEDKIILEHADGKDFEVKKFNTIFVLYGIKKNSKILEHLSKNIQNDTSVIYRTALDSSDHFEKSKMYLLGLFDIKEIIDSKSLGKTYSFILIKKNC